MSNPYADAISGIESGGRYGLLGPVTKSGDRAYGKFQVMGSNIPSWTQQFYGQSLTPQQFLNNPQAQDAVFQGKFGQYVNQYGPEGAAKAWFAGEGGMNNPNAKDMLGTTVQGYGQQFMANLNGAGNYPGSMTPGTQAPALPPPINVASSPIADPFSPFLPPAASPQTPAQSQSPNPFAMLAGLGGGTTKQGDQPIQPPQIAPNPIQAMAMYQPPPNTQGLQQLLSKAPVLRGLIV